MYRSNNNAFQSTPPQRGATAPLHRHRRRTEVSIHAHAGRRLLANYDATRYETFQSTPPQGGDTSTAAAPYALPCFNPRPRRGGATSTRLWVSSTRRSFNPRPRRGGGDLDELFRCHPSRDIVSVDGNSVVLKFTGRAIAFLFHFHKVEEFVGRSIAQY